MKLKLRWVNDNPRWRWADTIMASVLLGSAVGFTYSGRPWIMVVLALVFGSLSAWTAEQEWRIHLRKEETDG